MLNTTRGVCSMTGTPPGVGASMLSGAAASAAIHECVLAIKARVPIDILADTIHAFPSTSRILNGLFADALKQLDGAVND